MSLVLENNRPDSESLMMEEDVDDVNNVHNGDAEPPTDMFSETQPLVSAITANLPRPSIPVIITPEVIPQSSPEEKSQNLEYSEMRDVASDFIVLNQPEPSASVASEDEIHRLRTDLLMEETKLILMKKMYYLQNLPLKPEKKEETLPDRKIQPGHKFPASTSAAHLNGQRSNRGQSDVASSRNEKNNFRDPKLLMKGGTVPHTQRSSSNIVAPAVLELSKSLAHKQSLGKGQPNVNNHSGQNVSSKAHTASHRSQPHPLDVLEQQLGAEKMALKRQMEKSVLQIFPPKAPLPDLNFIPGTICPDFVALLGMELAASYAITSRNLIDRKHSSEPFVCSKCGEDVCQTWKKDSDSGTVVCEPCFMTSRSQAARLTHIENLKIGFADVLEKEREMDRLHAAALSKARAANLVENTAPLMPYPPPVVALQKVQRQAKPSHNQNVNHHNSRREVPVDRQVDRGIRASPNVGKQNGPAQNHREPPVYPSSRSSLPPAPRNSVSKPPLSSPFAPVATPQPYAPSSASKHAQYLQNNSIQRQSVERQYLLDMISRAPKTNNPAVPNAWRK